MDFLRAGRRLRVPRSNVWLRWTALAAGLHLAWELVQLPLYTIYRQSDLPALTYAVAHCTAGDALIALVTYLVHFRIGFGGLISRYRLPDDLEPVYGNPTSFMLFARVKIL